VSSVLLVLLLGICVVTDIGKRKIYNAVLLPFLCAGLIVNTITFGLQGLEDSLLGMLSGFGILIIPFLIGGMGAGDVKLLAVIGAIKGLAFVLMSALYMALAGGIMALLILLFSKGTKTWFYQIVYFFHGISHGMRVPITSDKGAMKKTYPYGIAIAAGAIFQVLWPGGFLK
jgi:prepilin peptidase CpaA